MLHSTVFVDLSHVIENDMIVFGSLPPPKIQPLEGWTHEESLPHYDGQACFEITKVELQTSTGTYMDSPYHRHREMPDISLLHLDQLILQAVVVDVSQREQSGGPISLTELPPDSVNLQGKAVLFYTSFGDRLWNTAEYTSDYPFLPEETVEELIRRGVKLVGVDTINVDDSMDPKRPAHTLLLKEEVLIVENLCCVGEVLRLLQEDETTVQKEATLFACPVKIKGAAAFPVRAFCAIQRAQ